MNKKKTSSKIKNLSDRLVETPLMNEKKHSCLAFKLWEKIELTIIFSNFSKQLFKDEILNEYHPTSLNSESRRWVFPSLYGCAVLAHHKQDNVECLYAKKIVIL